MKIHKPKTIKEAINDLETFLECDMPSMVFPEEKVLGRNWERVDPFKLREEVVKYLRLHFGILEKQITKLQGKSTAQKKGYDKVKKGLNKLKGYGRSYGY